MSKVKKTNELQQEIDDITLDLQRTRADFENYRKRVEAEKEFARESGKMNAVAKLLPVLDTIERASKNIPADIAEHTWVKGVAGLNKQLGTALDDMQLTRIDAAVGTAFNPELHQAIQFDEDADGDTEIIAEELRAGYILGSQVLRASMVKVTRK